MALFFFHFSDDETRTSDDVGLEFATVEQAYLEAVAAAQAMWPELLAARRNPLNCAFDIADANGEVLFHVPFGELVEACARPAQAPASQSKLHREIEDTHVRAQSAKAAIRSGFDEVRESLIEANALLGQLGRFEQTRRSDFAATSRTGDALR